MAGGVQRQADIGSGAPETLWRACRGWLSPVLQGPTLGLTAVVWDPCKERQGIGGPDLLTGHSLGCPLLHEALPGSVPSPHHAPTLPTPGLLTNSGEAPTQAGPSLCGSYSVHFEAGNQSSGQGTSRHYSAVHPSPPTPTAGRGPPAPPTGRYTCSRIWAGRLSSWVPNSAAVRKALWLRPRPGNTITWWGAGRGAQLHRPRPSALASQVGQEQPDGAS